MGEYRGKEWQGSASSLRERMDHLYNSPDMADLHILAFDDQWWWGQTTKDFMAHRLVLCSASPVFHQLFYPTEGGPDIPNCVTLAQNSNSNVTKIEIDGIPPIAVEALLEYCYKDRFDAADFENGYSRNLLWRLWHAAKIFRVKHLIQLCTETLESTLCEESVFWDLNYSLVYNQLGTENIRKRVSSAVSGLGNSLYEHPNLVWLDAEAIREILSVRVAGGSEPTVILNNILRWCFYQLDRTLCEDVDGEKNADIPLSHRLRLLDRIKNGEIKDLCSADVEKYLDKVLDIVPIEEMSQKDFLVLLMDSSLLQQDRLMSSCKQIMKSVLENPERLYRSIYMLNQDPNNKMQEIIKPSLHSPVSLHPSNTPPISYQPTTGPAHSSNTPPISYQPTTGPVHSSNTLPVSYQSTTGQVHPSNIHVSNRLTADLIHPSSPIHPPGPSHLVINPSAHNHPSSLSLHNLRLSTNTDGETSSSVRSRPSIKTSLEEARQRRNKDFRKPLEAAETSETRELLLVE